MIFFLLFSLLPFILAFTEEFKMKQRFYNPHSFDMSHYFTGLVCVLGGRDLESESDEQSQRFDEIIDHNISYQLDWSFLKNLPHNSDIKRF
jgi:hypothetical protein